MYIYIYLYIYVYIYIYIFICLYICMEIYYIHALFLEKSVQGAYSAIGLEFRAKDQQIRLVQNGRELKV